MNVRRDVRIDRVQEPYVRQEGGEKGRKIGVDRVLEPYKFMQE
jgi:hypothetical protein